MTPSFNQGNFLEATLRSVLLQGYPNLEYFVLDGGSTDASVEIIKKYSPWLSDWVSEPDRGQSAAINRGLRLGSGVLATWINSDDMLCENALVTQASRFGVAPGVVYVGQCLYIDAGGRTLTTHCGRVHSFEDLLRIRTIWRARGQRGHIVQPEVLFPRPLALDVGGLDPNNHRTMDYELWGRLFLAGARFQYTHIPVGMFRLHGQQKTQDGWRHTQSLVATAARLVTLADHLTEETRQDILADLRAYERDYWRSTGPLARLRFPLSLVTRLRNLAATLRRRAAHLVRRQHKNVPVHRKRVTNILMTCANDAGTGGVQLVFRQLVRSLEQNGRRVHLLYAARPRRPRLVQDTNTWGHTAFYFPLPAILGDRLFLSTLVFLVYLPVTLFRLLRLIHREKIDVINCHYLSQYFIHFVIAARLRRVRMVVSVHGADIDGYGRARGVERLILGLVMRGAHHIVACSQGMAGQTGEAFPDVGRKVTYVHHGLTLSDFSAVGKAPPLTTPFVLSVCRQVEKKGTDTLLCAFALVQRDFPDLSLVIIGDGPVLEQNKALARTLQIEKKVSFLGDMARHDVLSYFAGCTLFVLPSRAEPFGLVLLEAAYFKKGIVCTRVGGIPEIIADGVSGFLVEPDDPVGMAQKMTALLGDPQRAELFGARAHQALTTRFLWEDRVQEYLAIYEGGPTASKPSSSLPGFGSRA